MGSTYQYSGWSCPSGPASFVDWLVGRGEEVTYVEFADAVDLASFIDDEEELKFLATDWHVTYLRTELPSGEPAYVMQHSGIEHLFLQPGVDYYDEAQVMDEIAEWSDETHGVAWPEDLDETQVAEMRRVFFSNKQRTAAVSDAAAERLLRQLPQAVQQCVSAVTVVPVAHRRLYLEHGAEGQTYNDNSIYVLEPSAPGTITSFEERFYHEVGHVVARCLLTHEQRQFLYRHGDDMQHEEFASAFGAYLSGSVQRAQRQHSEVMPIVEAVLRTSRTAGLYRYRQALVQTKADVDRLIRETELRLKRMTQLEQQYEQLMEQHQYTLTLEAQEASHTFDDLRDQLGSYLEDELRSLWQLLQQQITRQEDQRKFTRMRNTVDQLPIPFAGDPEEWGHKVSILTAPREYVEPTLKRLNYLKRYWSRIEQYQQVEREIPHGPFTLFNQYGYQTGEYERELGYFDEAVQRLKQVHLDELLYGGVVLTTQRDLGDTAIGIYSQQDDAIFLAVDWVDEARTKDEQPVPVLLHEFGHRLWCRFLSAEAKATFVRAYGWLADDDIQQLWELFVANDFSVAKTKRNLAPTMVKELDSRWRRVTNKVKQTYGWSARDLRAVLAGRVPPSDEKAQSRLVIEPDQMLRELERLFYGRNLYSSEKGPSGYYKPKGGPAVESVSWYGKTNPEEDFCETLMYYCMGWDIPDQLEQRFLAAVETAGLQRRTASAPSSCPIRSKMYGGMPSGGGFGCSSEWEIGAQRAAEAAHCILGSLGRQAYGREFSWTKMLSLEHGHINEELGIIKMVMREYSRPLYTNRLGDGYYDPEDVRATVESVRAAGPELMARAEEMLDWWEQQTDVPPDIHDLGRQCYRFLIYLGVAMNGAMQGWPERPIQNPYKDPDLVRAVKRLTTAVEHAYQDAPPIKVTPWRAPEPTPSQPLTEEEKRDLERRDEETDVDHIMRLLGASTQLYRFKGAIYRVAADPVRDEEYRKLANGVYQKLQDKLTTDAPTRTEKGWLVRDVIPGVDVLLRPRRPGDPRGRYTSENGYKLITIFNPPAGERFWNESVTNQRKWLLYVFPKPTFIHEVIHYYDHQRAFGMMLGKGESLDLRKREDFIKYLSDPAEFNAWYQAHADRIETEMFPLVQSIPSDRWPDWMTDVSLFVRHYMRDFEDAGWRVDLLPLKLQRKIEKRLAMTFQHLWKDPEQKLQDDVDKLIAHVHDLAWNTMEQTIEGWSYMDDPDGVEERFSTYFGDDIETFRQAFQHYLRRQGHDADLSPAHQMKFNNAMRQLYRDLVQERNTVTETARRKQNR